MQKNDFFFEYISRIWTSDGTGSFIDHNFFKNIYFLKHFSVVMPMKILKAMSNVTVIKLHRV